MAKKTSPKEKLRYSDRELLIFKKLILEKLEKSKRDFEQLVSSVNNTGGNDTEDTAPTFNVLEEGASALSKEEAGQLALLDRYISVRLVVT